MGKITQKLVVYLDQNFISEMAKADVVQAVNPQFKKIYELLHQGFIEEKLTVPASLFHDIESSLIPDFKKRISEYQAYLGQGRLHHSDTILTFQASTAAREFLGEVIEPSTYTSAYRDDPDAVNQQFDIKIDLHMEDLHSMEERTKNAAAIDKAREYIAQNHTTYEEQYALELQAARRFFLKNQSYKVSWIFSKNLQKIIEFVESDHFSEIPIIDISCRMWAKILTHNTNRTIKTGDATDIDIVSAYLPYVDVLATDTFVANTIKGLGYDSKYKTTVFGAKKEDLTNFETFTARHLKDNKPVNRPIFSIFVFPDKKIREDDRCFDFFKTLGLQGMSMSRGGRSKDYVEIYAFDDGAMPKYYDSRVNLPIPFTGLQHITHIKIEKNLKIKDIVEICLKRSKSNKFVLIDRFAKLPDDFIAQAIKLSNENKSKIMGYQIA